MIIHILNGKILNSHKKKEGAPVHLLKKKVNTSRTIDLFVRKLYILIIQKFHRVDFSAVQSGQVKYAEF